MTDRDYARAAPAGRVEECAREISERVMETLHDYIDDCPDSTWEEVSVKVFDHARAALSGEGR